MSDIVSFSSKELDRAKQVAGQVRDAIVPYLKDVDVKVKDWAFSAGTDQKGTNIDVAISIELKPKFPLKQDRDEQKSTAPS